MFVIVRAHITITEHGLFSILIHVHNHSLLCTTDLQALQRTLEFEEELAERFGGSEGKKQEEESDNEGFDTKDGKVTASSIRKKYQKLKQAILESNRSDCVILLVFWSVCRDIDLAA